MWLRSVVPTFENRERWGSLAWRVKSGLGVPGGLNEFEFLLGESPLHFVEFEIPSPTEAGHVLRSAAQEDRCLAGTRPTHVLQPRVDGPNFSGLVQDRFLLAPVGRRHARVVVFATLFQKASEVKRSAPLVAHVPPHLRVETMEIRFCDKVPREILWCPPFENRERWGSLYCGCAGVRQPPSVRSPSDSLHGRSLAPLVKARGFGMTDLL